MEKVNESYKTERIDDELVVLKDIYSDDSEMQHNTNEVTLKKTERRSKKGRSKKEAVRSKKGKEIYCKERQGLRYSLTAGETSWSWRKNKKQYQKWEENTTTGK